VCSDDSDPIAMLVEAIDDLAAQNVSACAAAGLTERVASVWTLIVDLDPELARLAASYRRNPP